MSKAVFQRKLKTGDENDVDIKLIQEVFVMIQHRKTTEVKSTMNKIGIIPLGKEKNTGILYCFTVAGPNGLSTLA